MSAETELASESAFEPVSEPGPKSGPKSGPTSAHVAGLALFAGLDPTGGAGLLRDAWTVRSVVAQADAADLDVRAVVTVLTEQGMGRPARAGRVDPRAFADRVRPLLGSARFRPLAAKVGLVPGSLEAAVLDVIDTLAQQGCAVVLDPVLRASDGGDLGGTAASYAKLAGHAALITPNWVEAQALLRTVSPVAESASGIGEMGGRLAAALGCPVLLKGGHAPGSETVTDGLWLPDGTLSASWTRARMPGPDVRGTGCALSSAIATRLALGDTLTDAAGTAIAWLDGQRERAYPAGTKMHLPPRASNRAG